MAAPSPFYFFAVASARIVQASKSVILKRVGPVDFHTFFFDCEISTWAERCKHAGNRHAT